MTVSTSAPTPAPGAQTYSNTNDVAIPDAGAAVTSAITVSGRTGTTGIVRVTGTIKHTFRGDVVVDLIAPDGSVYNLKASSNTDGAADVVLDLQVPVSAESINGTWKLQARDAFTADTGYIDGWSITV